MANSEIVEIPGINFDSNGELIITPSATSTKHDSDFFEGKWQLRNRKLKSRLNNCTEWIEFESTRRCTGCSMDWVN